MSMFDHVECDFILPGQRKTKFQDLYQTYSLSGGEGKVYRIDPSGHLWRVTRDSAVRCDYSGVMVFYRLSRRTEDWREYRAELIDGQVMRIEAIHPIRKDTES